MHMRANWSIWVSLPLALVTLFSYPLVFVRWPITRDVPWVNLLLLWLTIISVTIGIRRAFSPGRRWFSKSIAVLLAGATGVVLGMFVYGVLLLPRQLPRSAGAPKVGQRAPEFTLLDSDRRSVALADLLTTPASTTGPSPTRVRGVLLIFYRGYW